MLDPGPETHQCLYAICGLTSSVAMRSADVTKEVNLRNLLHTEDKAGLRSPEVQNRGISGPQRDMSSNIFLKIKRCHMQRPIDNTFSGYHFKP